LDAKRCSSERKQYEQETLGFNNKKGHWKFGEWIILAATGGANREGFINNDREGAKKKSTPVG